MNRSRRVRSSRHRQGRRRVLPDRLGQDWLAVQPQQGLLGDLDQRSLDGRLRHRACGGEHLRVAEHVRADRRGLPEDHVRLHGRRLGLEGRRQLQLRLGAYEHQRGVGRFRLSCVLSTDWILDWLILRRAHTVTIDYHSMWKVDVKTGVVSYPSTLKRYEAEHAVLSGRTGMCSE